MRLGIDVQLLPLGNAEETAEVEVDAGRVAVDLGNGGPGKTDEADREGWGRWASSSMLVAGRSYFRKTPEIGPPRGGHSDARIDAVQLYRRTGGQRRNGA